MIATRDAEEQTRDRASVEPAGSAVAAPVELPVGGAALASIIGNRGLARLAGRAASPSSQARRGTTEHAALARLTAGRSSAARVLSRCGCGAPAASGGACTKCRGHPTALDDGAEALAEAVAARGRASRTVLARDTTVQVQVAPGGCSLDQHHAIVPAVTTASQWLRRSIVLLDAFIASPTAEANAATRTAMQRNFASTAVADATHVRGRFASILNDMLTSPNLRTECHTNADTTCPAANAYVDGSLFVFCPIFFTFAPLAQASSVIHEMAHALTTGTHITDRAYRSNRYYRWMTPAEARTNAESYGLLARELGTGTPVEDTAGHDTIEDCPPDWDVALARSTAIAERWNRNAQTKLRDRAPARLASWTDLQTRYLGGTTTAALDGAQQVYDAAQDAFRSNIDFECEPGSTGGRCSKYETYWYGWLSDFHICPSWRALPTEEARTESLLRGYYGYKDIVGDNQRRANLAALAHELNTRFWPAPTP